MGSDALDVAVERVRSLEGYRLIGPLRPARSDLSRDLDRFSRRAASAESGLEALLVFAGGSGPRRYLLFSQNPDDVRPTGGFLGTYGVVRARMASSSATRTPGDGGTRIQGRWYPRTSWRRLFAIT